MDRNPRMLIENINNFKSLRKLTKRKMTQINKIPDEKADIIKDTVEKDKIIRNYFEAFSSDKLENLEKSMDFMAVMSSQN